MAVASNNQKDQIPRKGEMLISRVIISYTQMFRFYQKITKHTKKQKNLAHSQQQKNWGMWVA